MPKSAPMFEDLLSLGGSLFGHLLEARHDMKAQARNHMGNLAHKFDLVSREEFDAAFAMLAKARATQEDLAERLTRIEAHLNLSSTRSSTAKNKKPGKAPLPSVKQSKNRKAKK